MVAESMVILLPIRQVGWFRASASVAFSICSCWPSRNGPPLAVRMIRLTSCGRAALHRLEDRRVLRIDRQHRHAAPPGLRHQQRTGDDQRFLVGQRQRLARPDRRQHRRQPRRPDDRRQDDVHVRPGRQLHQPLRPGVNLDPQVRELPQHRLVGGLFGTPPRRRAGAAGPAPAACPPAGAR